MNALRILSGITVVLGCHASLYPASTLPLTHAGHLAGLSTLPLTHAGHLPGLSSYASNTLSHIAHVPAATPYAQGYQHAAVAPAIHNNQHLTAFSSYSPQTLSRHGYVPAEAAYTQGHHQAIVPSVQTTQHHSQDELGQYDFGYSGGPSSRHETGDAYGNVRGSYSYVDAYGQVQKQSYVADEHGFRVVGTNLPTSDHHHLGKRSIASFPASTGPLVGHHAVAPLAQVTHAAHHVAPVVHSGHHAVAPLSHVTHAAHHVAPVVHSGHHVAHAVPVAHHGHSHQSTHYTAPGAHVSHVASLPSHGHGYGNNHGGFSYAFSAASPVYGYAQNHYAHAGHY